MNRPYTCVIMSIILVVIKLYVLSVILCVVSRHYRAACMQKLFQCFCRCYVYVAVCNVALNCYLIFGTAVIGLHAVADFLPLCMCSSSSMHYIWRIK